MEGGGTFPQGHGGQTLGGCGSAGDVPGVGVAAFPGACAEVGGWLGKADAAPSTEAVQLPCATSLTFKGGNHLGNWLCCVACVHMPWV